IATSTRIRGRASMAARSRAEPGNEKKADKESRMWQRWLTVLILVVSLPPAGGFSPAFAQSAKTKGKDKQTGKIKAADAAYRRAQAAFEDAKYDEAIKLFGEVLKIDPTYTEAWVSRGMAWSQKSEYDKAIKDFNEAVRVDPKFVPAFFNRGMAWNSKA